MIVDEFASRPLLEARFLPVGEGIPLAQLTLGRVELDRWPTVRAIVPSFLVA